MQVGFSIVIRNEQAEIEFHGRRLDDPRSLVAHAQHGRLHAVVMGRLTYRSELANDLGAELVPADLNDDAALALAAYRQWGERGLARLEGCYALAIWDGNRKLLLGSRDPFGGYPLFWAKLPDGIALGTCQRPLLQLLPSRSLNLDYVAEYLALPGAMYSEPGTRHCVYEGIRRVSPGSMVRAQMPQRDVQEKRYWSWVDKIVDPGSDRLEDLGDLVGAGLRRAVGEQLRGRVAAHVSGGMDSTAVALLARDFLRGMPGQPDVQGVSLVFEKLGGLARETPYVDCALEQPGIAAHRVPGDDLLDYDCFVDPPMHDEPMGILGRMGVMAKMAHAAAETGARTLLTGYAAEAMIDLRPYHLADLLQRGRLISAWKDARAWGHSRSQPAWSYLWKYGLSRLLPAALQRRHEPAASPWIESDFYESHALRDRERRQTSATHKSRNVANTLGILPSTYGDCISWYVAAPHGMTIVHPFMDTRFAATCMGIQSRFRQTPGTQKPLLGHAMRDVLPKKIVERRIKSHYNALVHNGLVRNMPFLEGIIHQAPADGLGVINKDALLECLQQVALGYIPLGRICKLDLTLSFLRWHSLQSTWQQPVVPAQTIRVGASDRLPAAA